MRSSDIEFSTKSLTAAIEAYEWLVRLEGKSKKTLVIYGDALKSFHSHVGDVDIDNITPGMVRSWLNKLLEADYAKTTINMNLRAVKTFFNWLVREGYLQNTPMTHIRQLNTPNQYPFVLTDDQVWRLLKTVNRRTWTGKRNWTILLTFLDAMIRLSELRNLELADLNLQTQSIRVRRGKGGKERIVFMGRRLTRAMKDWLQIRERHLGETRLFVSQNGFGLDRRNVQRIVERTADRAKLEGIRCSPHTLRHTGATLFIRNGGDPFSLQRLLGHADIQTTMIYVHMAGAALKEAHSKASPVDKLLER